MKKVYTSDNPMLAGYMHRLLENENINCLIKNHNLSGGIGELPPIECWPEVWILHDDDYQEAMNIINNFNHSNNVQKTSWNCNCGEVIEGQFEACWQCGAEKQV